MNLSTFTTFKHSLEIQVRSQPNLPLSKKIPKLLWGGTNEYPRICAESKKSCNTAFHQLALGSTICDSVFRSSGSCSEWPTLPTWGPNFWLSTEPLDAAPTLLRFRNRLDQGNRLVLVVPVLRHKMNDDQEHISLLMLLSNVGCCLIGVDDEETVLVFRHILEDNKVAKVFLNAALELPMYWITMNAAVRNGHCYTSHFRKVVAAHGFKHWSVFKAHNEQLPRLDRIYPDTWLRELVLLPSFTETSKIGSQSFVKFDSLLDYGNDFVHFLYSFTTDKVIADVSLESTIEWPDALSNLMPYLQLKMDQPFWSIIGTAMRQHKDMSVYIPCWLNVLLREGHYDASTVKTTEVDILYDQIMRKRGFHRVSTGNHICLASGTIKAYFIACMSSSKNSRSPGKNWCRQPGCYKDVWDRLQIIAPVFCMEFMSAF